MSVRHVGAPDPNLRNSPIMEPVAQEEPAPEMDDSGYAVCYFNDEAFDHGSYVHSGDQVLRCERGIWMVIGTEVPELP